MQVLLTPKVRDLMALYVHSLDNEISGIGEAHFDKDLNAWLVTDIMIFEQDVTSGSATIESKYIAAFIVEATKAGKDLSKWCVWWHSHNTMSAFFSNTDTDTMNYNPFNGHHLLSIVTNNKAEFQARLDVYDPCHIMLDKLDVSVHIPQDTSNFEAIKKEVAEKVTQTKFTPSKQLNEPHYSYPYDNNTPPHKKFVDQNNFWTKLVNDEYFANFDTRLMLDSDPRYCKLISTRASALMEEVENESHYTYLMEALEDRQINLLEKPAELYDDLIKEVTLLWNYSPLPNAQLFNEEDDYLGVLDLQAKKAAKKSKKTKKHNKSKK